MAIINPRPRLSPQKLSLTRGWVRFQPTLSDRQRKQNTSTARASNPKTPNMAPWPWLAVKSVPTSK